MTTQLIAAAQVIVDHFKALEALRGQPIRTSVRIPVPMLRALASALAAATAEGRLLNAQELTALCDQHGMASSKWLLDMLSDAQRKFADVNNFDIKKL
jgi:hypothetical protein